VTRSSMIRAAALAALATSALTPLVSSTPPHTAFAMPFCNGPQQFGGPKPVYGGLPNGSQVGTLYSTLNQCTALYYQAELYKSGSTSWVICDTNTRNNYQGCNPNGGFSYATCSPCRSPGQVYSSGVMVASYDDATDTYYQSIGPQ